MAISVILAGFQRRYQNLGMTFKGGEFMCGCSNLHLPKVKMSVRFGAAEFTLQVALWKHGTAVSELRERYINHRQVACEVPRVSAVNWAFLQVPCLLVSPLRRSIHIYCGVTTQ